MLEQFHTLATCFLSLSQSSQAFWYILLQEQMGASLLAGELQWVDCHHALVFYSQRIVRGFCPDYLDCQGQRHT
jgi:hypothetical protein